MTLGVAITGSADRRLAALQLAAALTAILAGIVLWHVLHAGPPGPTEHLLATGSFCAFVALGLQMPVVVPPLFRAKGDGATGRRYDRGALLLCRASTVPLALAAAAMVGSMYA